MPRRKRTHQTNQFDHNLLNNEKDLQSRYLGDPVELAGRFIADSKWQHKADLRMQKCEELLSHIIARSGKPGHNKLLSFHSEVLMLGGGDARLATTKRRRRRTQALPKGISPKPKHLNPITYSSPLLGSKVAKSSSRRTTSTHRRASSRRQQKRPFSASPAPRRRAAAAAAAASTASSSPSLVAKEHRPQSAKINRSAYTHYLKNGTTPSANYVRPYTAALPLKLDLPWMRIKSEPSKWRVSWEPSQPLTYTPQQQLTPIVGKRKKKTNKRPDEHRVVDWARKRRALLEPLMKEKNDAAQTLQRFFLASKHVGIRDRWMSFRAGELLRRHYGATVIQRYGRGYIIRKRERTRLNWAATVIQGNGRVVMSRHRVALFRKVVAMRQRIMAKKIQRGFRKGSVGRGVKRMVAKAGQFGKNAIVKMQGLFRGKLARKKSALKRSWLSEKARSIKESARSQFRAFFSKNNPQSIQKKKKKSDESSDGRRQGFFKTKKKKKTKSPKRKKR